jgi:hypothetical protein
VVLRVVGEEQTGKSYTYSFIHHLSVSRSFTPVRLILDRSSTAEDILRDLSLYVARNGDTPRQVDDPVKRMRHWAQWLVEQARHSAAPQSGWWFVFDQCNELDPSSDAVELIAQLAIAVREMTVQPGGLRPRLVLLGYGDQLADLQLPRKQVVVDTVDTVGQSELCDFFSRVFRSVEHQRRPEAAPDEGRLDKMVEVAVQQVLEDAAQAVAEAAANGRSLSFMDALGTATEEAVDVYSA